MSEFSERVVREAVDRGMESPLRETIVDAVEEASEDEPVPKVPFGAAMLGLGGTIGYLLGIRSVQQSDDQQSPMVQSEEPEIIEEETEEDAESGGSWLKRIALVGAIVGAVVLLRQKLKSSDTEEWEPIEEFETSVPTGEDSEDEPAAGESIEINTEDQAEIDDEDEDDLERQNETDAESEE